MKSSVTAGLPRMLGTHNATLMSRCVACAAIVFFAASCGAPTRANGDEALKAKFLNEAPGAWENFERFSKTIRMRVRHVEEKPTKRIEAEATINGTGDRLLYKWTGVEGKVKDDKLICAINNDYSFILEKKSNMENWEIRYVGKNPRPVYKKIGSPGFLDYATKLIYVDFDDVVESKATKVQDVTRSDGEGNLVRVAFTANAKIAEDNHIDGGWVNLDPNRNWSVREFEISANQVAVFVHGTMEYGGELLGYPVPKRRQMEVLEPTDRSVLLHYTFEYDDVDRGNVSDSECRLSAYGFPEPGFGKKPWIDYWMVGGSLVIVAGLFITARYLRSKARSS
jgi:hypothetical protein